MPVRTRALLLLIAPILSFISSALFMVAYWIGHWTPYIALAMVFLIVAILGLAQRRRMLSVRT